MTRKEAARLVSKGIARMLDERTIVIREFTQKNGANQGEIVILFEEDISK